MEHVSPLQFQTFEAPRWDEEDVDYSIQMTVTADYEEDVYLLSRDELDALIDAAVQYRATLDNPETEGVGSEHEEDN